MLAEQRDELAAVHSMTSSARASSVRRDGKAERLRGFEVDEQIEFRRQHDRQVTRLFALQNAADIVAGLSIGVGPAGAVADEAAGFGLFAIGEDRRQGVARRQDRPASCAR